MNRRQVVMLPGLAALAAGRGFSKTPQAAGDASTGSATLSHKLIAHYSRLKSFYKIPKTEAKQAKYINFFTTLLALTPDQQQQTAGIFASASAGQAAVKAEMKVLRQNMGRAVTSNNLGGINSAAVTLGTLSAKRHTIGAAANAAFYQILSANQQATLNQWFPEWEAAMTTPPSGQSGIPRRALE